MRALAATTRSGQRRGTEYRVRLDGTRNGQALKFDWTFSTEQ
jgi:hypothetical protein